MRFLGIIILYISISIAACPVDMYEDTCGNCWLPYCYDYVNHEVAYDINEADCAGQSIWVIPGTDDDPYYDNYH